MPKEKPNGRTNGSDSQSVGRLARAVATKRKQRDNSDNDFNVPNNADAILTSDSRDVDSNTDGTSGADANFDQSTSRNGSDRRDRIGTGDDGTGSDGSSDHSAARTGTGRKRGRRSAEDRAREFSEQNSIGIEEARKIIESQKRPRKVKSYSDDIGDGVVASALLLGAVFEGGSELLAMSVGKPYFKLDRAESTELGDAILKVLDTLPKSTRKKFDLLIAKYYPYWNLAKVATKISYPRYLIYQMEMEARKNVQASTPARTGNTQAKASEEDSGIETSDSNQSADFDFTSSNFG